MGPAGTGKSFLVKSALKLLQKRKLKVCVTATTGIACCVYDEAMTIHKLTGIGDGRFEKSDIRNVVEHNVKFHDAKNKIICTDVLFIDECLMMSTKFLESLHEVCKIKDENKPFGGIQEIFCNYPLFSIALYNDSGKCCFESPLFSKMFPHRILLTEVARQTEKTFINVIRQVSTGDVSDEAIHYLKDPSRPIMTGKDSVKLFSNNDQVDFYNRECILNTDGDLLEYRANEQGDKKLQRILAPSMLWLKIGAPVMLLFYQIHKGEVTSISTSGPVVTFPSIQNTIPLNKVKLTVFDPRQNSDIAVCEQFPIKLAFGITIHKAQGMTLDRDFKPVKSQQDNRLTNLMELANWFEKWGNTKKMIQRERYQQCLLSATRTYCHAPVYRTALNSIITGQTTVFTKANAGKCRDAAKTYDCEKQEKTSKRKICNKLEENGVTGFRFPFAHFVSDGVQAPKLYSIFWDAVDKLRTFGFNAFYTSMDGAQCNRTFIKMHINDNTNFTTQSPCSFQTMTFFIMDPSHVIKKIRNIIKSGNSEKHSHLLTDTPII
ncbi:PIF1-like protein [Mya arenaria]|uniref:ATP-dependent DNA helicase n=1 Tax=Mya arenaria TaxID=6604 RepID=A0ABY7EWV7_MYAAR|nr:PIF1-like protein [Mya arenaria]